MNKTSNNSSVRPSVHIVEASAGSGKTYALAKQYVQFILNPALKKEDIPLRAVLAITFTNKAALEMKARILEFLKEIALDCFSHPEEKKDILASLGEDQTRIREKAFLAMDFLIRNYNFFQVQTIDSFINALLSGCAFKLNLSSRFRIKNDYSDYLTYCLDELIEKAKTDPKTKQAFEEFLRQYLYLEHRTSWWPKNDIAHFLDSLVGYSNIYGADFTMYRGDTHDLIARRKSLFGQVEKLATIQPEATDKRLSAKLEKIIRRQQGSVSVENVSTFFDRPEYPIRKGNRVPAPVSKLWAQIRDNIRALCEQEAFVLFNCYVEIFNRFFADFNRVAASDDVVFLASLNRQARLLFDSGFVTVPELYFRLSSRFTTYLIDEFQDTSYLQWKNLVPLIEDGIARGGTLFYVGDKKQAIYRFRGGDVSLFDHVKEYFDHFSHDHSVLGTNYRSQQEIVQFNNTFFSAENLMRALRAFDERDAQNGISFTEEDREDIVRFYRNATQTARSDKPFGYVQVESVPAGDEDEKNACIKERLIALIRELSERFAYADIAILARDNKHVELCASWLIEAGIPVESDKTVNIREHSLIKELVCFVRFLQSPIDNLSFVSFIIGDIFLAASGLPKQRVLDFLFLLGQEARKEKNLSYYRRFREEFPQVWEEYVEQFFKSAGLAPLYELAVSILQRLRVFENFSRHQGFFMRFLELISVQEEEYPSIAEFLAYFDKAKEDELYVSITETDSVHIMTIHKAKGLEFGVVITPFVCFDISSGGTLVVHQDDSLTLLRLKKEYTKFSPQLQRMYRLEYKKAYIDELNNMYVAFTRARDELYIFVPQKKNANSNNAHLLFTSTDAQFGSKVAHPLHKSSKHQDIFFVPTPKYRDWIPLLREEFRDPESLATRTELVRGEIMHAALSFVADLSGNDVDGVIREAMHKTKLKFPFQEEIKTIEQTLKELLQRESWKEYFFLRKEKVFREKEFVTARGETRRMDRLIVGTLAVKVIDYKSSHTNREENMRQMREYLEIVRSLYPEKSIEGIFLYFDTPEVDRIYG